MPWNIVHSPYRTPHHILLLITLQTPHHVLSPKMVKSCAPLSLDCAELVSDCCRAKISELAKSGLILVDLRATVTGELYGDTVWRFSQLPRPARQPPSAAAQLPLQPGTKGNQGTIQFRFNMFNALGGN